VASVATFRDVDDLARFCAALLREGVKFEVTETQAAGVYRVTMMEAER
jgi:hypothetical protein